MPDQDKQIKYWRNRAKSAEDMLGNESHINTFMISWIKRNHPEIHRDMCAVYDLQGKKKSSYKIQVLQERRREKMTVAS